MASKHQHEPESMETLQEGEFRRISGIGPGIEQRLRSAGIETFEQLAGMNTGEILDALQGIVGITPERITAQDWTGQAYRLAEQLQKRSSSTHHIEEIGEHDRQHYESFMIELLLEEDRTVRRTRVVHVQNGEKENWAGWRPDRMIEWLTEKSEMTREGLPPDQEPGYPKSKSMRETMAIETRRQFAGKLNAGSLEIIHPGEGQFSRFYTSGEPLEIILPLDLSQVTAPSGAMICYQAHVQARQLGVGKYIHLAEIQGEFPFAEQMTLAIQVAGLEPGTYRLETAVRIYPVGSPQPEQEELQALAEGGLIQVFSPMLEMA